MVKQSSSTRTKRKKAAATAAAPPPAPAERVSIEYRPLAEIERWPRNPKRHAEAEIAESFARFGFTIPLLVDETSGKLTAGHGRVDVLTELHTQGKPPPRRVVLDPAGGWLVPVLRGIAFANEDEAEAYLLADNGLTIRGGFDEHALLASLQAVQARTQAALTGTGYGPADVEALVRRLQHAGGQPPRPGTLSDRFVVPPFTVLDARQGYWQDRKREWIALGIKGELGRGGDELGFSAETQDRDTYRKQNGTRRSDPGNELGLRGAIDRREAIGRQRGKRAAHTQAARVGAGGLSDQLAPRPGGKGASAPAAPFGPKYKGGDAWRSSAKGDKPQGAAFRPPEGSAYPYPVAELQKASGTSIFDPVLCEVVYRWFTPGAGSTVLDPFAGECTKGICAAVLGLAYTGVELRAEQIAANVQQAGALTYKGAAPRWIQGDAAKLADLVPKGAEYDLLFTSPPYYDLEVYSQSEKDGSAFETYERFMTWYRAIWQQAVARLRRDRFLVVKIGEVRDRKTGGYRNFLGDNIQTFLDCGLTYYNEAVLITAVGSLPVRAGKAFAASRKLGKSHQNVLVFYKGDPRQIPKHFTKDIPMGSLADDTGRDPAAAEDRARV